MSAITEQLREAAKCAPLWKNIFEAAADEIERLQKKESHLVNVGSVNKIKADGVQMAINKLNSGGDEHPLVLLVSLRDKLEQGEV
tara:strand:- start:15293 stop:15547 length:255 start_codon:yes stop_codon:yes gene_type:complete